MLGEGAGYKMQAWECGLSMVAVAVWTRDCSWRAAGAHALCAAPQHGQLGATPRPHEFPPVHSSEQEHNIPLPPPPPSPLIRSPCAAVWRLSTLQEPPQL